MKRSILVALFFVLIASVAYAGDNKVPLYKDFYHGMTRSDVNKRANVVPCLFEDGSDSLCVNDAMFAGVKWKQAFNFSDGKLTHITIASKLNDKNYSSTLGAIVKNNFVPALMRIKNETCDFSQVYNSMDRSKAEAYINDFEARGLRSENILYIFFEKDVIASANGPANISEIIKKSPVTMRQVEMEIFNNNEDTWLAVRFLAPKMSHGILLKQMDDSKDTF